MNSVQITNWKDLVDQFGLDDTYMGTKSARQISTHMRKEIEKLKEPPTHWECRYTTQGEGICLFVLVSTKG